MSLEDFNQLEKIGEGAYSEVFKVRRKSDGKIYALKKWRLGKLKEKEKENSLNEIRILASVRSPYIVSYKEAFFDERSQYLCLIMEYADAGDLLQKIQRYQKNKAWLDEAFVWKVISSVVKGLNALHEMQIFHRDLKSANVFLYSDGQVKLGDLNVSKVAKKGLLLTQTGTPYYASPEVWKDKPYDSKSDIWSLGCVIYEAAAQRPPFRAQDMNGLYQRVMRGQFTRIPNTYSDDMYTFIRNLLQVSPVLRPSCEQILAMPAYQKNIKTESEISDMPSEIQQSLLKTIYMSRDMKMLKEKLPKPNYEEKSQRTKRPEPNIEEMSQRTKRPEPIQDDIKSRKSENNSPDISRHTSHLKSHRSRTDLSKGAVEIPKSKSITPDVTLVNKTKMQILKDNYGALALPPHKSPGQIIRPGHSRENSSSNKGLSSGHLSRGRSRNAIISRAYGVINNRNSARENDAAPTGLGPRNGVKSVDRYPKEQLSSSRLSTNVTGISRNSTNTSRVYRPQMSRVSPPWWG